MLERIVRCRIAAFLLVLAGCAVPPPAAVITGSKIEAPLPGSPDDLRIFVMEIDNKLTLNGPEGWNRRIVVPPGKHLITFGIAHELKVAGPFHAVTLTMDEGKVYTLRARAPVSKGDDLLCASAWIEEGGAPVTAKIPMSLVYKAYGYRSMGNGSVLPLTIVGRKAPLGCEWGY